MSRRDPLERIVDLVVAIPLSVVAAARQLVPFDAEPVERRLEALVGRHRDVIVRYGSQRSGAEPAPVERSRSERPSRSRPATPTVTQAASAASAAPDARADALAIDGYDQLSARQIVDRLGELTPDELGAVARYERSNRRRQTVLGRIEQLS